MKINEEDWFVKNYTPNIDFKKQAIICNINYYNACHTVGAYFHHLYDFLDKHKIISFTIEEKLEAIENEKEKQAAKLLLYKHRMEDMAYEYALTEIATGKIDLVVNGAKIELLKKVIANIDLEKIKTML